MRRLVALALIAALGLAFGPVTALADPPTYAQTVTGCGAPGASPQAGYPSPVTVDGYGASCEAVGTAYTHISTATTTTVKSGAGWLHAINIGTCVSAATVTVFDNTAGSGTIIAKLTCPAATNGQATFIFDAYFATGLTLVTSGATDVTVSSR